MNEKDKDFRKSLIEKMVADLDAACKKGAEGGINLGKLLSGNVIGLSNIPGLSELGDTFDFPDLSGFPGLSGLPGLDSIPNLGELGDTTSTLIKATMIIMKQESKLKYLESLLGPVTMIVRDDSIPEFKALDQIKEILKDLEVQAIECHGDCNNCDREH